VVHDVERIGDYAKGLLELMKYGEACSGENRYRQMVRDMRDQVEPLFGRTLKGLRESDGDACREVMRTHRQVKAASDEVMDAVMGDAAADRSAFLCAIVARYIRRVSAHLSNVASSVVNPLDQLAHKEVVR
jgi:phosphate uptake regulator